MVPTKTDTTVPSYPTSERLLDLEEVAKLLGGISTRSVRRLIARGDLPPAVKVLSAPRLYYSDVMGYLDGLKQKRETSIRKHVR
jgi:predicted DNA-binding transcriptional regulator AlpA